MPAAVMTVAVPGPQCLARELVRDERPKCGQAARRSRSNDSAWALFVDVVTESVMSIDNAGRARDRALAEGLAIGTGSHPVALGEGPREVKRAAVPEAFSNLFEAQLGAIEQGAHLLESQQLKTLHRTSAQALLEKPGQVLLGDASHACELGQAQRTRGTGFEVKQ